MRLISRHYTKQKLSVAEIEEFFPEAMVEWDVCKGLERCTSEHSIRARLRFSIFQGVLQVGYVPRADMELSLRTIEANEYYMYMTDPTRLSPIEVVELAFWAPSADGDWWRDDVVVRDHDHDQWIDGNAPGAKDRATWAFWNTTTVIRWNRTSIRSLGSGTSSPLAIDPTVK